MKKIRNGWFKDIWWQYYDADGLVKTERGMYLICDNGYLRWPQSMCPYVGEPISTVEGYFSSNLESVRKDVECVFGILKERWCCLQQGFKYCDIKICQEIFVVCCVLHNMMLDEMSKDDANSKIGRGICLPNDGMWLDVSTTNSQGVINNKKVAKELSRIFHERRTKLARHLHQWRIVSKK